MSTLYLLAPRSKNNPASHQKDFHTIVANRLGPDYGISARHMAQIYGGMPVVVFDRDRALQVRGIVVSCAPTKKAGNGVQRYNVVLRDLVPQQYNSPPAVNRFGVAIY